MTVSFPKCSPPKHHRKTIRLKGYDYTQAELYFITLCCQNRICFFGDIENGKINLNVAGRMVENEWLKLPVRFANIELHDFIVMPNHFHAIFGIVGATLVVAQNAIVAPNSEKGDHEGRPYNHRSNGNVGNIVGTFKSMTTNEYIRGIKTMGWLPFDNKLWQRNYFEHIIRNQQSYLEISDYINTNDLNWDQDSLK